MSTTITAQERAKKRMKLKELTSKIQKLLTTDPRYRDNDALLINRIQRDEMIVAGLPVDNMSMNDFFRVRLDKKVSSEDSITRLRREVQEYYPETRGDKYKERQSKVVDVVDDLHEIENDINSKKAANKEAVGQDQKAAGTFSSSAPTLVEKCDHCQGSGKYEAYPCNVCDGTGEVQFK